MEVAFPVGVGPELLTLIDGLAAPGPQAQDRPVEAFGRVVGGKPSRPRHPAKARFDVQLKGCHLRR